MYWLTIRMTPEFLAPEENIEPTKSFLVFANPAEERNVLLFSGEHLSVTPDEPILALAFALAPTIVVDPFNLFSTSCWGLCSRSDI